MQEFYIAPMCFQGLDRGVELGGDVWVWGFFYVYGKKVVGVNLNDVEVNVHDHRNIISKGSAIEYLGKCDV